MTFKKDLDKLKPGEALSFIDGLVPDTLMDDAKRQNFVGIQFGSATSCVGATTTPYRTEQEKFVAHRTSVKHARVIDKPGKIVEVLNDHVKIKYDDGEEEAFPLGRWFGPHEGTYYPHTLVTKWKRGDKLLPVPLSRTTNNTLNQTSTIQRKSVLKTGYWQLSL